MRKSLPSWNLNVEYAVIVMRMIKLSTILSGLLLLTSIVQAQTTENPTVSNPALRAELLNIFKRTDEMRERLEKCAAEFHECDAPMDRLEKAYRDDAVRLKEIVKQYGWPGNDLVGQDGSLAATVILLNAELALKKEMLPLVKDAHRAGKTDGSNYAFLVDDIRVAEGKPQLYGTRSRQGRGTYPIEDEANVDKRRVEVGLPPLAEELEKERNKTPPQKTLPQSSLHPGPQSGPNENSPVLQRWN